MMTVIVRLRKAKKAHKCAYKPECMIMPGQEYVEETTPPWTRVMDDPDFPPSPTGEWWHTRYHSECWSEWMYG